MARHAALTALVTALTTAVTYLLMHLLVAPHLPVREAEVPTLAGLSAEQARALLAPRGLLLTIDGDKPDDRQPPGRVLEQRPYPTSRLRRGSEVHVVLAVTPDTARVPSVVGMTLDAAREAIGRAKLRAATVEQAPDPVRPQGVVAATRPAAGEALALDGAVTLVVSSGPAATQVPSVLGKRLAKARELLEQAGFAVGGTRYGSNDDYDQGVVIKQVPAANAAAPRGTKVDLVIND